MGRVDCNPCSVRSGVVGRAATLQACRRCEQRPGCGLESLEFNERSLGKNSFKCGGRCSEHNSPSIQKVVFELCHGCPRKPNRKCTDCGEMCCSSQRTSASPIDRVQVSIWRLPYIGSLGTAVRNLFRILRRFVPCRSLGRNVHTLGSNSKNHVQCEGLLVPETVFIGNPQEHSSDMMTFRNLQHRQAFCRPIQVSH